VCEAEGSREIEVERDSKRGEYCLLGGPLQGYRCNAERTCG
jgi:hypothetical protein